MAQTLRLHDVLQWRLAVVAGLVAGAVFLALNLLYVTLVKQLSPWVVTDYMASIVLGARALLPPSEFDAGIALIGLLVNFTLAIIYSLILASIIHRWGFLVGIIGGALYGAALYFINLYTFTLFYPGFFALDGGPFFLNTVLFGAVSGGVYELLDYDDRPFLPTSVTGGMLP